MALLNFYARHLGVKITCPYSVWGTNTARKWRGVGEMKSCKYYSWFKSWAGTRYTNSAELAKVRLKRPALVPVKNIISACVILCAQSPQTGFLHSCSWSHSIHGTKQKRRFYNSDLKYFYYFLWSSTEKCKALYRVNCILVSIFICFAQCVELGKNWFFYAESNLSNGLRWRCKQSQFPSRRSGRRSRLVSPIRRTPPAPHRTYSASGEGTPRL